MRWDEEELSLMDKFTRFLVENGFESGIYVGKEYGQVSIVLSRRNAEQLGLKKFGIEVMGETTRLKGVMVESPDQLKMLIEKKWLDHMPFFVFRLPEQRT